MLQEFWFLEIWVEIRCIFRLSEWQNCWKSARARPLLQPIGPAGQRPTLAHLCDHPWGRGRRGRRRGRPIERLLTRRREVQRPLAQRLALLFLLGHVPVLVVDFHHARGVGDGWSSNLLRPRRTLGALTVVEVPVANHLVGRRSLQTTWTSRGGVLDGRLDDRFDDLLDERVDVLRARNEIRVRP